MAILNNVLGGVTRSAIKLGGATVRGGISLGYGLGEAGAHAVNVGIEEYNIQEAKTIKHLEAKQASFSQLQAAMAARKAEALNASAPLLPVAA